MRAATNNAALRSDDQTTPPHSLSLHPFNIGGIFYITRIMEASQDEAYQEGTSKEEYQFKKI